MTFELWNGRRNGLTLGDLREYEVEELLQSKWEEVINQESTLALILLVGIDWRSG